MRKRKLAIIVAAILAALFVCACGGKKQTVKFAPETDFKVADVQGGVSITGYLGSGGQVNIPEKIGGKPVVEIGFMAFYEAELTGVTIPDTVVRIDEAAFSNTLLVSVVVPDSVKEMEQAVFMNCTELENITFPANLTEIANNMIQGCEKLTSVEIPDGVTQIGQFAFSGCTGISNITLPDNMRQIHKWTFFNCDDITVTYNGVSYTFNELEDLCNVINGTADTNSAPDVVDSESEEAAELKPEDVFYFSEVDGGVRLDEVADAGYLGVSFGYGSDGVVKIPNEINGETVIEIESGALACCFNVTGFEIPSGVRKIGSRAFWGCDNLEEIDFYMSKITEIEQETFG
ncbi:MAG: leucine-rich repeat domain-containing protein, partial [Lachnospiraceae bacterium]|nr:leucine-rich repeat domain-containing protein [Lachnospiraceae bacterium]